MRLPPNAVGCSRQNTWSRTSPSVLSCYTTDQLLRALFVYKKGPYGRQHVEKLEKGWGSVKYVWQPDISKEKNLLLNNENRCRTQKMNKPLPNNRSVYSLILSSRVMSCIGTLQTVTSGNERLRLRILPCRSPVVILQWQGETVQSEFIPQSDDYSLL